MPLYNTRIIEHVFNEDAMFTFTVAESAGRTLSGEWNPGELTSIPIKVATQPLKFREMRTHRIESETGSRDKEIREFYFMMPKVNGTIISPSPLRPGESAGDIIEYKSVKYRIESINDWSRGGYVEVIAVEEQPTSQPSSVTIPTPKGPTTIGPS